MEQRTQSWSSIWLSTVANLPLPALSTVLLEKLTVAEPIKQTEHVLSGLTIAVTLLLYRRFATNVNVPRPGSHN